MKKNILLISGNYFPEPTGIGKYNNEMMIWLADHGFNCTVISTYPYYPFWQIQIHIPIKENGLVKRFTQHHRQQINCIPLPSLCTE